jgi:hypothetical protein
MAWERVLQAHGRGHPETVGSLDAQAIDGNDAGPNNTNPLESESFSRTSSSEAPSDVQRRRQRLPKAPLQEEESDSEDDSGSSGNDEWEDTRTTNSLKSSWRC